MARWRPADDDYYRDGPGSEPVVEQSYCSGCVHSVEIERARRSLPELWCSHLGCRATDVVKCEAFQAPEGEGAEKA